MSAIPDRPPTLRALIEAIAAGNEAEARRMLTAAPALATAALGEGAGRQTAGAHFLTALRCYVYEGDTALHVAAAAWNTAVIERLVALGADPRARNRRGGEPLHYAASGDPQSERWNPPAQAAAIGALLAAGADPNAADKNGTTPLHRAVRTRCAAAVEALLQGGADATIRTRNGSTPAALATVSSGRGGAGSPEAKAQQALILERLGQEK
jgi:hypothetical protein